MATLPPGWAADYDGSRWFFVYHPTGHFQYQFPKPGDEFPDFGGDLALGLGLGLGLGGDQGPVMELSPEERLESERQVRRNAATPMARRERNNPDGEGRREGQGGAISSKGADVGVAGDGDEEDEGGGVFCFESFGYFGPAEFGREASADETEDLDRAKAEGVQQRGVPSAGGIGLSHVSPPTSIHNTPRASISEPSAAETFSATGEATAGARHPGSPGPSLHGRAQLAETGPAVAALETTARHHHHPAAQPDGKGDGQQPQEATAPDVPMLDGRAVDSVPQPLAFSPSRFMPELYSELTALCEEEINPPPVELPDNGASWLEPVPVPNLLNQYPVELPADGGRIVPKKGEVCSAEGAVSGDDGRHGKSGRLLDDGGPDSEDIRDAGSQMDKCPRANTMPPKLPPKEPLAEDEALHGEIMGYFQGCSSTPAPQGQPTIAQEKASAPTATSTGGRHHPDMSYTGDLAHFPSVLRPGPRRSSQPPPPQQPGPGLRHSATEPTTTSTTTAQRAHAWPSPPPGRHDTALAELPSHASFRSVPIGPPVGKPRPVAAVAAAAAVNFVIPIDHRVSPCDRHGSAAAAVAAAEAAVSSSSPPSAQKTPPTPTPTPEPEYHLSANFASLAPGPRPRPRDALDGAGGDIRGQKTGRSGRGEEDKVRPAATGGPTKAAPEWSWGCAR